MVSKLSPQAGVLLSPSMQIANNNDIFVQKGQDVGQADQPGDARRRQGGGHTRRFETPFPPPHHVCGKIKDKRIPASISLGSHHTACPEDSRNNEKNVFSQKGTKFPKLNPYEVKQREKMVLKDHRQIMAWRF